jgi:hypothetical protein
MSGKLSLPLFPQKPFATPVGAEGMIPFLSIIKVTADTPNKL